MLPPRRDDQLVNIATQTARGSAAAEHHEFATLARRVAHAFTKKRFVEKKKAGYVLFGLGPDKGQCAWLKPPGTHDGDVIATNQACAGNAVKQMAIAGRQIANWQCRELGIEYCLIMPISRASTALL